MKPVPYTLLMTAAMILRSVPAIANTNTAISSGAWETGSNWSTGIPPVATDNVIVPAGITMTVKATADVCASLTIIATGDVTVNGNESLSIGGNFTNAGTFFASYGSTLTFNGVANAVISGGGTYTVECTIVLNMGSSATALDVQDANFIVGINNGGRSYFTFIQGTFKMDNSGTLNNCYNSGSSGALTIPYGVVIESDNGVMYLARNAKSDSAILSGELFMNGGIVEIQSGQALNSGYDFRYSVNGGTPQLYISSGSLYIGAGFNPHKPASDYIDFNMTGGRLIVAENGYSDNATFLLADNVGGKTFMSGGTIILQDACNAAIEDLDMGGANVAMTLYSVTGGTVQLGYAATQAGSTFFGVNAEPATNYPNITFQSGVAKTVGANNKGLINMLSIYINSNMTYDATGFSTTNIMSNNGTYAFDNEGTFSQGTNTVAFTGSSNQVISSATQANINFYNLKIANTSGNVTLGVNTTVQNQLSFTSGLLDASKKSLTLSNGGVAISGASSSTYAIVGTGVAPATGYLNIANLPGSSNTLFPIGTASYYMPAYVNPEGASATAYSAYVFTPATTNAKANGTPTGAPVLANMYNAIWNITQTSGTGGAGLILGWASTGDGLEGSTFSGAGTGIGIAQYTPGAGWGVMKGSGNVVTRSATSSFASLSQYAIVDELFVLPVVVSNFRVTLTSKKTAQLSWSASDDAPITGFDVQRSTDGIHFNQIGTLQTIPSESSYSFMDVSPVIGVNYYRLVIRQIDGPVMYSAIKTIDLSLAGAINVYPVPATTSVNVSLANAASGVAIRLVSQAGHVLQTMSATGGSQVISIDISMYPTGIYFVQVVNENAVLQTATVTKL